MTIIAWWMSWLQLPPPWEVFVPLALLGSLLPFSAAARGEFTP